MYIDLHMYTQQKPPKKPVYADLQHSTNPPAPPLPAELVPVQHATVKKQTDNTVTTQSTEDKVSCFYEHNLIILFLNQMMQDPVNSDLQQSTTDPPCAEPVQRQEVCSL